MWYNTQRPLMRRLGRAFVVRTHKFWMQIRNQISRFTLKKVSYGLINHSDFERVPTDRRVLDFIAFMPGALQKFTH